VVAGSQVSLVARKRCVDRRKFKFKLHHAPGQPVVKVVAFVNGKKKLTKKGTDVTSFTLRKLPKGKFKVKIIATQASGSKITSTRTYKGCKKSKPKSKGHHHRHH
jgi:hypothetical protein